jgi:ATP-dependent helicase/nuclease subunit B
MPSSTPEDDWNVAHAVTACLLASAPHIVFSYAQRDRDAELRPSPLVAGLFTPGTEPRPASASPTAPGPIRLEPIPDQPGALPWPTHQHAGGSDVLRRQAACPFQAFAAKRLAAAPLDCAERGLNPIEKGNLVHKILQEFFSEVRNRDELVTAIATNELLAALDRSIEAILGEYASDGAWQQAYLAAERRRLQARLTEWLTLEAQRHFFTVESCEQKLPGIRIGDLRLDLRADRIDLLADGSRLILDYKTGEVSPASWRTDRPEEPQLPLYAAYGNVENLSGVVFAKIRAGKTCFDGRLRDAQTQLLSTLSTRSALVADPYTSTMRDDWARVLAQLAERFLAGDAAVNPRKPSVCDHCDFPGLCRKAELDLETADDYGEEAPDA